MDLIERQAAIDAVSRGCQEFRGIFAECEKNLNALPSAQPTQPNASNALKTLDCIDRQAAIDAICAVCGNDCDKSEFVYNAPQDEQVILCPEHYCLCTLPSVQPQYEELTPEEAASEIASGSTMTAWYWLDDMIRIKQMGYVICRKR